MSQKNQSEKYKVYHKDCIGLEDIGEESVHALITDPPYGISYQNNHWDKQLPDKQIWADALRVLKPGGYGLVFSAVRLMHRMMVDIEDAGFIIKDVLMWAYLNGMPKSRDLGLEIDKELGVESEIVGSYKYVQGYKKGEVDNYYVDDPKHIKKPASQLGNQFAGAGLGIKPAYEPIILIQKAFEGTVAQNMIKHGTGGLNLEETRIPYADGEQKVGHNPHPKGRVAANLLRTDLLQDGYDKFFAVPKVRQNADEYNTHPTLKPVELMTHLVKLISFEEQTVLDPFMGSGSTGVACLQTERYFVGFEREKEYYDIAEKRLSATLRDGIPLSIFG